MAKWRIVYDWYPDDNDTYEVKNLEEIFKGSWDEMREHIVQMRNNGCYNIRTNKICE